MTAEAPGLGKIRSYYNKGGQLSFQADGRTGKNLAYVYLSGSLVATREQPTAGGAAVLKFHHTDALGSPVAVTNSSRSIIETSKYEPYGSVINRALRDGHGFTGHIEDAQTGLNYMQQRYYDPAIAMFLSVDPVTANSGTGANFNRYWYANNNPYRFTDPDGRAPVDLCNMECKRQRQQDRQRKTDGVFGVGRIGRKYTGAPAPASANSPAGPLKSGYVPAVFSPTQPSSPETVKHEMKVEWFTGESSLDFQAAGPGFGVAASKGLTNSGDRASAVLGAGFQATYNFNILKVSWQSGRSSGPGLSLGGTGMKFAAFGGADIQFNANQGGEEFVLNGSLGFSAAVRAGSIDYSTED